MVTTFQKSARTVQSKRPAVWKCLASEFFGTFLLTFAACAPIVMDASNFEQALCPGLLVMVMIYALGNLSGAHFNPAVTLAFALRHSFDWKKVPGYWLVQVGASAVSAYTVRMICGNARHLGATLPHSSFPAVLAMEVLLSTVLIFVILGTSKQHKIAGNNAAIAVGATICLCGIIGAEISGASMNPARSFGPGLVDGSLGTIWIYILGPLTGSLIATVIFTALQGLPNAEERKAAEGEGVECE